MIMIIEKSLTTPNVHKDRIQRCEVYSYGLYKELPTDMKLLIVRGHVYKNVHNNVVMNILMNKMIAVLVCVLPLSPVPSCGF